MGLTIFDCFKSQNQIQSESCTRPKCNVISQAQASGEGLVVVGGSDVSESFDIYCPHNESSPDAIQAAYSVTKSEIPNTGVPHSANLVSSNSGKPVAAIGLTYSGSV